MRSNTTLLENISTPENDGFDGDRCDGDIVAVATPPGYGGISIVRLSGAGIPRLCKALIGTMPTPRHATLCGFCDDNGEAIDRGLVLYFPAPNSYTGEHVVELHGHGSPVVMGMLLRRCLQLGARLARPGEFSERAFLRGRMDLTQAEAVADLIESSTEAAARSALRSMQGEFSDRIQLIVKTLTETRILVEASIDFPDEGGDTSVDDMRTKLDALQQQFRELRGAAVRGNLLRDGLKVVLIGPPNAGKSSLFNALSQRPRAIVSALPGTTRDILEQFIELDGVPVEVVDTAGIRSSTDEVEVEGVRRAREAQKQADVTLLVIDDGDTLEPEIARLFTFVEGGTVYLVRNKIDLSGRPAGRCERGVGISALHGDGMEDLLGLIKQATGSRDSEGQGFIARQRHLDALQRANQYLDAGIAQLLTTPAMELLAEELVSCQRALGEITGEVSSDDLLGMIFSSFCIGK